MKTIVVELTRERETKNTVRFRSVDADSPVDVLYVRKSAIDSTIDNITVTVTQATIASHTR